VRLSPRTIVELLTATVLVGLLIWQTLSGAALRVKVAQTETSLQAAQLIIQAKDVSAKSCQAALDRVNAATNALHESTMVIQASTDEALQRAQDRTQEVSKDVSRLLSVRAAAGQDCQTATGLARSAWEEGQ